MGRRAYAFLGGLLSLAATVLLPFHLGGGLGALITAGFLMGGVALAAASLALARSLRVPGAFLWALAGAAGFVVSGAALWGDVIERPFVIGEIAAVAAVAVWWLAVWRGLRGRTRLAGFSVLCAACAVGALVGQFVWEPPAGAVPVRFAYVLWGPWGLWLAAFRGSASR
jgi:hypothetical protein